MACQMEMVLSTLIRNGYNLDYKNGTFKKYVGDGEIFTKVIVNLEEVHLMDSFEIRKYLNKLELEALNKINKRGNLS